MALTREEKTRLIDKIANEFEGAKATVFTEYRGLNMKDTQVLRERLRQAGVKYQVVKATLVRLALQKAKLTVPEDILDKPLAVAVSQDDEVVPAKLIVQAGKEMESLKVLGGIINHVYSDSGAIKRLAALPGRDELYARVAGRIASPLTGLVGVLQGNIRGLAAVLLQRRAQLD